MKPTKSIIYQKAFAFAIEVVNCHKQIQVEHKEYVLSKQFVRSGTSIGANISEAVGGISRADFSHKMSIAFKEALETNFWLDLMVATDYLSPEDHQSLHLKNDEITRILYSILT